MEPVDCSPKETGVFQTRRNDTLSTATGDIQPVATAREEISGPARLCAIYRKLTRARSG